MYVYLYHVCVCVYCSALNSFRVCVWQAIAAKSVALLILRSNNSFNCACNTRLHEYFLQVLLYFEC